MKKGDAVRVMGSPCFDLTQLGRVESIDDGDIVINFERSDLKPEGKGLYARKSFTVSEIYVPEYGETVYYVILRDSIAP